MFRFAVFVFLFPVIVFAQTQRQLDRRQFEGVTLDAQWIYVKVKPQASLQHEAFPLKVDASISMLSNLMKVRVREGQDPVAACNELLKDPDVIYAEPIRHFEPLYDPNDENSVNQEYLAVINAYNAWDISTGDDDITIGIIDTGLDLEHEDLRDKIWINQSDPIDGVDNDGNGYVDDYYGYDFADNDHDPTSDGSVHGTRVGGIAGASTDNGIGISGVAFNTKIAALKGFTTINNTSNGLFDAIIYAADNGIDILNLSWGSIRNPLQSEQDIINYAVLEKDVVVVAAAGNTDVDDNFYPASYDNVLSVSGTELNDTKWVNATYNYEVDLVAPSTAVYTTVNSTYGSDWGTSYAAPMVAATAALVKDVYPNLTARQIMERVRVTADNIYDVGDNSTYQDKLGYGRLDVYDALNTTGIKSIRIDRFSVTSPVSDYLFWGDSIEVSLHFTNYLGRAEDPVMTMMESNRAAVIGASSRQPGVLATLQEDSVTFQLVLSQSLDTATQFALHVDITDGLYNDYQYLRLESAPDYLDFGNEAVKLTVASDGNLGFARDPFRFGNGLTFHNQPVLNYLGFMIAKSDSTVFDNIINNYERLERDQDFETDTFLKLQKHRGAANYGFSMFRDTANEFLVEQQFFAAEDENYVGVRYAIVNLTTDTLLNTSFGFYADWHIAEDQAVYDERLGYTKVSSQTTGRFVAAKIMGVGDTLVSVLTIGSDDQADIQSEFGDRLKLSLLHDQKRDSIGFLDGGDISELTGRLLDTLLPNKKYYFDVLLAVGNTSDELDETLNNATSQYNSFVSTPPLYETVAICQGADVSIDPSNGVLFNFYKDPKGLIPIASDSVLYMGTLESDTAIYLENIDAGYPTRIYQVTIRIFEEIASFDTSVDTLYLDNPTNVVQFTDESIEAISWLWDFGQGSQSSIQHPSMLYDQPGEYNVSLTITNAFGCTDTSTRTIVVAHRPGSPNFGSLSFCPNEAISLSDEEFETLIIYQSEGQKNPIMRGTTIQIGPLKKDSTFFVSGIQNGFESLVTPVYVDVYEVNTDYTIIPDTLNVEHGVTLVAEEDADAYQWVVNEQVLSVGNSVSFEIIEEISYLVNFSVTDSICADTVEKELTFSSSVKPSVEDVTLCVGDITYIKPSNGTYFGFYEDAELQRLIKKGTQLSTDRIDSVYVVGLDDGLPGDFVRVKVERDTFDLFIQAEESTINGVNTLNLTAVSQDAILTYNWYLNGAFLEVVANPIVQVEKIKNVIALNATNRNQCVATDTAVFDYTETVLGSGFDVEEIIYPNPSGKGLFYAGDYHHLTLLDLSGRILGQSDTLEKLQFEALTQGVYLLRVSDESGKDKHFRLIKK